jgi:hypothetical protein
MQVDFERGKQCIGRLLQAVEVVPSATTAYLLLVLTLRL